MEKKMNPECKIMIVSTISGGIICILIGLLFNAIYTVNERTEYLKRICFGYIIPGFLVWCVVPLFWRLIILDERKNKLKED